MENLTGRQLGPYQIFSLLGGDGATATFRAGRLGVSGYLALKVLPRPYWSDPAFAARFEQGARAAAGLKHARILSVDDFGTAEGYFYLVTRFLPGGSLADSLTGAPLALPRVSRIISQVAEALDYANAHGVLHNDVKPANVLIDEQGNCLLADFGVAGLASAPAQSVTGEPPSGAPYYASPEQCLGQTLDVRSDVYSLGVMLYELATGRLPFTGTPMDVVIKHVYDPVPSPRAANPALPEEVEGAILKALAKDPVSRYQTAGALAAALAVLAPVEIVQPAPAAGPARAASVYAPAPVSTPVPVPPPAAVLKPVPAPPPVPSRPATVREEPAHTAAPPPRSAPAPARPASPPASTRQLPGPAAPVRHGQASQPAGKLPPERILGITLILMIALMVCLVVLCAAIGAAGRAVPVDMPTPAALPAAGLYYLLSCQRGA